MRSFMRCMGLWMPGVSKSTIWPPGRFDHGQDAVARGLRLVGDDRDLLAHQPVHERGLAHVGPADHGHEAAAEAPGAGAAHALRLGRLAPEAHPVDALALGVHDLEREAAVVDALARARDAAEDAGHQAAHRVDVLAVGQRASPAPAPAGPR